MNPADLPFDSETMLQGLAQAGWNAKARPGMRPRSSACSTLPRAKWRSWVRPSNASPAGRALPAAFAPLPAPEQGQPGILIAGHLDTVHPIGTIEKLKFRREGNKCFGPGIFDMKGGNYLTLEAIRQLGPRVIHDAAADDGAVHPRRGSRHARPATSSRRKPRATNTCWCRSRAGSITVSSPGVTRSRGST